MKVSIWSAAVATSAIFGSGVLAIFAENFGAMIGAILVSTSGYAYISGSLLQLQEVDPASNVSLEELAIKRLSNLQGNFSTLHQKIKSEIISVDLDYNRLVNGLSLGSIAAESAKKLFSLAALDRTLFEIELITYQNAINNCSFSK